MKNIILLLLLPFFSSGQIIDHSIWDALLKKHVDKETVHYQGFMQDIIILNKYLDQMSKLDVTTYDASERKAFWINLYNASTVKLIIDHWPVKSIRNLYDGKPWDQKIVKTKIGIISLNNIEHDILRKKYADPRIHSVVNCASKSCPPLSNSAYSGAKLDQQMEKATFQWINSKFHNQISENSIMISKIFEWYSEDFGNIIEFLNKYSDTQIASNAKIDFLSYDWALNN